MIIPNTVSITYSVTLSHNALEYRITFLITVNSNGDRFHDCIMYFDHHTIPHFRTPQFRTPQFGCFTALCHFSTASASHHA